VIGYFILGICLLAALLVLGRTLLQADPRQLARILRLVGAGVLGAAATFLVLTGRLAWGMPLALLALALLRRWALPFPTGGFGGVGGRRAGQTSEVESAYLRMVLDHDSGEMQGEVLQGAYAGQQLSQLDLGQLVALLAECHREDPESAQLLETYLDRTHGSDWRDAAQQQRQDSGTRGGRSGTGSATMSPEEAREVLGVDAAASPDEIREAHRRLMLKLHPDKGGSGYLAAKINQAKDVLLGV